LNEYDLIVLGSGPAGEKGAAQAAYFGKRVALIEKEPVVGGACVNTGTVPSKTLRESALHLRGFKTRQLYGIDLAVRKDISIADFMFRKQKVVEQQWRLIEANLRRHRIERYQGQAEFLSSTELTVRNGGGETRLKGNVILICTGSSPYRPRHVEFDERFLYDSDSILSLDRVPQSLAVVGAGVIGCEYASIFAALGIKVHLLDGRTALLPHIDVEMADVLVWSFANRLGIEMHLGHEVQTIEKRADDVRLQLADGSEVVAEKVLYAAGRSSNTQGLNLAAAGVQTGNRGVILVNDRYQTNVPNIYAAGDVIGFPALASTSMEQARVAVVHAFDLKYKTRIASLLPYGIYTIPEVSMVGKTEQECQQKDIPYETGRAFYQNNARGQIIGDTEGMIKLVFDPESLRLHGVHIVGENASELLHVGLMVMQFGGTINAFIESVFNYPTLGDAYKYAAYDGLGNIARKRLS
jgi:NAD(P) transhydrogenase